MTTQTIRCDECRRSFSLDSAMARHSYLCEDCEHAHYQEAHEALYGHEECKTCGSLLVHEDEQASNYCRRCSGVEHLYERDDDGDDRDDA